MLHRIARFGALAVALVGSVSIGHSAGAHERSTETAAAPGALAVGPTVILDWTADDLGQLTDQVMSVDPPSVPAAPQVAANVGVFRNSAGGTYGSNRRDFWLHAGTAGWTDSRVVMTGLDPTYFGNHPQHGWVIPQGGVVLRYQTSQGKIRGITLNNNVFYGTPNLNVGVWEANADGTGFENRQTSFDFWTSPGLPYGFEAILDGNIIRVRTFSLYDTPPDWSDTANPRVRTINLDTDAGNAAQTAAIPTPTGPGTNGVIAAHVGTDPISAVRLHPIRYERQD